MTTSKITEMLSWKYLASAFPIGSVKVDGEWVSSNGIKDAIEDGIIDTYVQECADKLHSGDVYSALLAWSKNLSSMRVNLNKAPRNVNSKNNEIMYSLLREYVTDRMTELKGTARGGNAKPYWRYDLEDIAAITDVAVARSVYNNMASVNTKYPERAAEIADFAERRAAISAKKRMLEKAEKEGNQIEISESLIEKLNRGKNAHLSAEEAATIAKLLETLND